MAWAWAVEALFWPRTLPASLGHGTSRHFLGLEHVASYLPRHFFGLGPRHRLSGSYKTRLT